MLKAVPNKNSGFIILFTSILLLFYFMRSVSMSYYFVVFTSCRFNSFYLWFWFFSFLSLVWIGGQFPQDNFLSYARILTLYYYFLLMCILFFNGHSFSIRPLVTFVAVQFFFHFMECYNICTFLIFFH
jgi:hypothetical protein